MAIYSGVSPLKMVIFHSYVISLPEGKIMGNQTIGFHGETATSPRCSVADAVWLQRRPRHRRKEVTGPFPLTSEVQKMAWLQHFHGEKVQISIMEIYIYIYII